MTQEANNDDVLLKYLQNGNIVTTRTAPEDLFKKMNNFERLKQLSIEDFAFAVCMDNEGENRGCCPLCKRHFQNNCDDRCIKGVIDYLQEEDK